MEHTFVISAYKESQYLEECIESLKNQTVPSEIILSTSTPSQYLEQLCLKYAIKYCVRDGQPGIAADWNYALSCADTPYVTIAHQDDIYEKEYTKYILEAAHEREKDESEPGIIIFTDYSELVDGVKYINRTNLRIKRILLWPLKRKKCQSSQFWRRHALWLGNAISCPTITYHVPVVEKYMKEEKREELFRQHFRSNLDWEVTEWLSKKKGAFVYVPRVLIAHRIHAQSETTMTIQDNMRGNEDYEMFVKFWPKWIAKLVTRVYSQSEKSNEI